MTSLLEKKFQKWFQYMLKNVTITLECKKMLFTCACCNDRNSNETCQINNASICWCKQFDEVLNKNAMIFDMANILFIHSQNSNASFLFFNPIPKNVDFGCLVDFVELINLILFFPYQDINTGVCIKYIKLCLD